MARIFDLGSGKNCVEAAEMNSKTDNLTVIRGKAGSGKTRMLRRMLDQHNAKSSKKATIYPVYNCTEEGLRRMAAKSDGVLFLDECREDEVRRLAEQNPGITIVAALHA